jgi:hypothetical protein
MDSAVACSSSCLVTARHSACLSRPPLILWSPCQRPYFTATSGWLSLPRTSQRRHRNRFQCALHDLPPNRTIEQFVSASIPSAAVELRLCFLRTHTLSAGDDVPASSPQGPSPCTCGESHGDCWVCRYHDYLQGGMTFRLVIIAGCIDSCQSQ